MTSEIGQVCNVKIGGMYVREIIILSMVKISQFNCELKLHLFISVCLDNKKHNYIKTFDEWGDVFDIYFEIRVDILPDCGPNCVWTNVLHFNAGGDDNANYGDRIPAVNIYNNGLDNSHIQIASALNGNKNYVVDIPLDVGKLYKITIRQYYDSGTGRHYYEVLSNGASIDLQVNTQAKRFLNVKFYLSNPWTTAFAAEWGHVCNLNVSYFR